MNTEKIVVTGLHASIYMYKSIICMVLKPERPEMDDFKQRWFFLMQGCR